MSGGESLRVGDRDVALSHLDKVMYPGAGITKGDVVEYYRRAAEHILHHLRDRPLTLRRYPDGIDAAGFFQKEVSGHFPAWVERVSVDAASSSSGHVHHVLCQDAATLVYLANQGTLELHPWLSRVGALDRPDRMVVDLDPADGVPLADVRRAARDVRDALTRLGLTPFLQTSGGRGYHVTVPLDAVTHVDTVRELARGVADRLAAGRPDRYTTAHRKSERGRRVLLDVARNGWAQTAVAPYTLRARPGAPAATPLDWDELGRVRPDRYTLSSLPRRMARKADPWAAMAEDAGSAAEALARLDGAR